MLINVIVFEILKITAEVRKIINSVRYDLTFIELSEIARVSGDTALLMLLVFYPIKKIYLRSTMYEIYSMIFVLQKINTSKDKVTTFH